MAISPDSRTGASKTGSGGGVGTGTLSPPTGTTADQSSAKGILDSFFALTGLGSLADQAWQKYLNGDSVNEIELWVTSTPEYAKRFPAAAGLAAEGNAIDPATYIAYENNLRQVQHQYGIPSGIYDTPEKIANMLLNHVSAQEVGIRAQGAAAAVYSAPDVDKAAFAAMYGPGSTGALTAYWLEPDHALPLLTQQWQAAQITGAGAQQGIALDTAKAEQLAKQGVSRDQAMQGLGAAAAEKGLTGGFGETADLNKVISAQFGDTAAAQTVARVQRGRLSAFQGGGSIAAAAGGVTGLGAADTG